LSAKTSSTARRIKQRHVKPNVTSEKQTNTNTTTKQQQNNNRRKKSRVFLFDVLENKKALQRYEKDTERDITIVTMMI
jgi:hypothetical protein